MTGARRLPVAVAISTLDRPNDLERCLAGLRDGTALPADVVVVDQGRGGAGEAVARAVRHGLAVRHVPDAARGLARAQNLAVRATAEPLVAVLDDDCVPDAHWVEVIERAFATEPELDAVAGRVLPLPPEGERVHAVSSRTAAHRVDFRGKSAPWHVGSGNNFALRREWWERIGGCDERLGPGSPGLGGVDMDLFYRLLRAGACVRYEPDALVYHRRATRAGRLARRFPYGHGLGACVALWLRQGDPYAVRVLGSWLGLRGRLLARALLERRWLGVYEELLVLWGTVRGLLHGARA